MTLSVRRIHGVERLAGPILVVERVPGMVLREEVLVHGADGATYSVNETFVGLTMALGGYFAERWSKGSTMPPLGLLTGKVDFANQFVTLKGGEYPSVAAAKAAGATTLNYGLFLNNILTFVIVGAQTNFSLNPWAFMKSFRDCRPLLEQTAERVG